MLNIRKATKADAKPAWDIRNNAILNGCIQHYSLDILEKWTSGDMPEQFIFDVEKNFYVATLNDQVVGTGMINTETGKVDAIFVHSTHMGKGIGKMIVNFLENIALRHGLKRLTLESTLNAAAFYRACGFKGETISTYESPRGITLDCIPMDKSISCDKPINSSEPATDI